MEMLQQGASRKKCSPKKVGTTVSRTRILSTIDSTVDDAAASFTKASFSQAIIYLDLILPITEDDNRTKQPYLYNLHLIAAEQSIHCMIQERAYSDIKSLPVTHDLKI